MGSADHDRQHASGMQVLHLDPHARGSSRSVSRAVVPAWTTALVTSSLTSSDALSVRSSAPHASSISRANARAFATDLASAAKVR